MKILIVDDEPLNVGVLANALKGSYEICTALSGDEAISKIKEQSPDLILLDVMMPEMNGFEVCRLIRAEGAYADTPIIFVTALDSAEGESEGLELGAVDYITKPVNLKLAKLRIRNQLELKRQRNILAHHRRHLEKMVVERTAELRALAGELAMAEERERRSIARDLHDDLGQSLALIKLKLKSMATPGRNEEDGDLMQEIQEISEMVDHANRSVRSLSLQLSPPALSKNGLVAALEWLSDEMLRTHGLHVHISDEAKTVPQGEALSSSLYRTVRELLINVSKHAKVDQAEVSLFTDGDKLVITVADAGMGFDVNQRLSPSTDGGYGLFSVRERLRSIGGEFQIDSLPGDGTLVVLTVPLDALEGRPGG